MLETKNREEIQPDLYNIEIRKLGSIKCMWDEKLKGCLAKV